MEENKKLESVSSSEEKLLKLTAEDIYGGKTLKTLLEIKLILTTNPGIVIVPEELTKLIKKKISSLQDNYANVFVGKSFCGTLDDKKIYYYVLDASKYNNTGILIELSKLKSNSFSIKMTNQTFYTTDGPIKLYLSKNNYSTPSGEIYFNGCLLRELDFKDFSVIYNQCKYLKDCLV